MMASCAADDGPLSVDPSALAATAALVNSPAAFSWSDRMCSAPEQKSMSEGKVEAEDRGDRERRHNKMLETEEREKGRKAREESRE
jgi:hypothetical protein